MDKFGEEKIKYFDISPNEAVAFGAAIVADKIEVKIFVNNIMNSYFFRKDYQFH